MTNTVPPVQMAVSLHNCDATLEMALRRLVGCADDEPLPAVEVLGGNARSDPPALVSCNVSRAIVDHLARRGYRYIRRYAVLPSRQRSRWLVPHGNSSVTRGGFQQLCTPFLPKSRILKGMLTRMMGAGIHQWFRQGILVASKQPLPLERLVTAITGEEQPTFAFSFGTSGPFRKMTVHVMNTSGETLGYVKVPLGEASENRVRGEATTLGLLQQFPALRAHLSHLLYAGSCGGSYVIFQSPLTGDPGPVQFTRLHEDFLQTLQNCHRGFQPGKKLIHSVAEKWGKTAQRLGAKWQSLGRDALHTAARQLETMELQCGIAHGDFAPWNTRVHDNALFLFDWESAQWDAPLSWDKFHFQVQVDCLLNKGRTTAIFPSLGGAEHTMYLLYLLQSGSQLVEEDSGPEGIEYRERLLREQLSKVSN